MKKNLSVAKGGRSWRRLFKNPWVEIMNSWPQIYISFTTRETEKPPTNTQNTIITCGITQTVTDIVGHVRQRT